MRRLGFAAIIILGLAGPALAEDKPPIVARAEACLARNVDQVVAADPDINSAANFLVAYACATEVSGAQKYERNVILVKAYSGMFGAMSKWMPKHQADAEDTGDDTTAAPAKDAKAPATKPATPAAAPKPATADAVAAGNAVADMFKSAPMTVDPETGDIVVSKATDGTENPFTAMLPQLSAAQANQLGSEAVPVSLRRLAGVLVLAAHEKRTAPPAHR